jgi:hypothetical protein
MTDTTTNVATFTPTRALTATDRSRRHRQRKRRKDVAWTAAPAVIVSFNTIELHLVLLFRVVEKRSGAALHDLGNATPPPSPVRMVGGGWTGTAWLASCSPL